ncbi:MAG: TIGR01777 family oxidoreductase [Anaerolineales bacterium]
MRVIITGGSGLIGRALSENLTKSGHEVIILSRQPAAVPALPGGVRVLSWDASTAAGWATQADGADAIINLAGESLKGRRFLPSRWTARRKQLIRQSRQDAGAAVVQAVREAKRKPKVVVQVSAVGYYGPRGTQTVDERAAAGEDFLASVCTAWEASTAGVEALGVRQVVARMGIPLTMQGGAFPLLVLPFRFFGGNTFGSGQQVYPWIHFEDAIAALLFLVENPKASGPYNLSAPNPVSNREFARTLGRTLRRPVWIPVPRFALQLALGEVSTVVMDGQRAVPARLLEAGFAFRYPDLQPALQDLLL